MADTLQNHNYFGIDATVIADSKNEFGKRLTTFVITFPRIVLAEFNTHRMISRNSASSRAVPFETMLERVNAHPFIPIKWMKDHRGMQGNEFFDNSDDASDHVQHMSMRGAKMPKFLEWEWLKARDKAVEQAKLLSNSGLTKQIVNRLLEPWMWHTAIVSATEWENFYALRAEAGAEIHIQELAYRMLEAQNASTPKKLKTGEWHIPFGDNLSATRVIQEVLGGSGDTKEILDAKVKIATARCARVSYINFEGKDDYKADISLHNRLAKLGHWSPFEHCAKANDVGWPMGNFAGFTQYRKTFSGENRTDNRLLK